MHDFLAQPHGLAVSRKDDIAIVGMSVRLPGGISRLDALWEALVGAQDLVTEIPSSRWAIGELSHPKRAEPGRSITFQAGVLPDIEQFDAGFFGISPREAALMDPQQRLTLELAWDALEDAGIPASSLAGSDCAVFLGISGLDYGMRTMDDLAGMTAHSMTGNTMSIAANRLSYKLDLRGPSMAVDTACSSSLVALHQACQAIRVGEASAALAGGVSLLLHPYPFVGFTKASMLSVRGRCQSFAEGGDGYVRAEGGGMVVLKPLAAARRDGDRVLAVIRGTGVNADGARKSGMTIPSGAAQQELMCRVLEEAGLQGSGIDYLEAHGTGTPVGDPIEAKSVGAVYGQGRATALPIGSIKSNLGHMEPASGMAGLAKAVLVLRHGEVPPGLHAARLNKAVDFAQLGLEVVRRQAKLPNQGRPLRAAVNSFGFGGVNGHVILEAPDAAPEVQSAAEGPAPLVISARDETALRSLAGDYAALLGRDYAPRAIAHAAWARRHWHDQRLCVPDFNAPDAGAALSAFAAGGEPGEGLVLEPALAMPGRLAFIYSGNGAQWVGMGRRLQEQSPDFAVALEEVVALIRQQGGPDVLADLHNVDPDVYQPTEIAQPALFALQVAGTVLLRAHGLQADAVMGHSVGEVAAAWAAGALSLEEAAQVVVARSRAQALTRGTGKMAAVALGGEALREAIAAAGLAGEIEIAAENSPGNATLSGDPAALAALKATLGRTFFRELDLDYAFHSARMDPIQTVLATSLAGLAPGCEAPGFYSSVTGGRLPAAALGADYWWRNVRLPVLFAPALASMAEDGCRIFIEVGPNAILQRYISETLAHERITGRVTATAPRREDTQEALQRAAFTAILAGAPVAAASFFPPGPAPHLDLPTYPWQRQRHWATPTAEGYALYARTSVHELLGYRLKEPPASWEVHLDPAKLPYLADHKVGGAIVLAGASYLEMALAASRDYFGGGAFVVQDLDILSPVVFDAEHGRTVRLVFQPADLRFTIEGRTRLNDTPWTLHAQGRMLGAAPPAQAPGIAPPDEGAQTIPRDVHYAQARAMGLDYGPAFRGIESITLDAQTLRARLAWARPPAGAYLLHPAILDQCFQAMLGWASRSSVLASFMTFLPVSFGRLSLWRTDRQPVEIRARLRRFSERAAAADFELLDEDGALLARLEGARFRAAALVQGALPPARWAMRAMLAPLPSQAPSLPENGMLAAALAALAPTLPDETRYFTEIAPLVEMLPACFVRDAMASSPGVVRDTWAQGEPWQRWLLGLAEVEGLDSTAADELPETRLLWQTVLAECPAMAPALLRIGQIGTRLAVAPCSPFAQLSADLPSAPALAQTPLFAGALVAAKAALARILADWPAGRPVRILDAGLDSESWFPALRPELAGHEFSYAIARADEALSAGLRIDLAEAGVEILTARATDLGFEEPGHYDIVLLGHALHRLAQPGVALAELAQRLENDGLLLLGERGPDHASRFTGGSQTDMYLRDAPAWEAILEEGGWACLARLQPPSAAQTGLGSFLIAARPPSVVSTASSPAAPRCTILQPGEGWTALAQALHDQLAAAGAAPEADLAGAPVSDIVIFAAAPEAPADSAALARGCEALRQTLLESARLQPAAKLWVVTSGGALQDSPVLNPPCPAAAAIWGLARTAANELNPQRLILLDLPGPRSGLAARILAELQAGGEENEIILTETARHVLRMRPVSLDKRHAPAEEAWRLDFTLAGQLRNLHWQACDRPALAPDVIEIEAKAAGLNFRDVMYATGLLPDEALENGFAGATLGLEIAGRVARVGAAVTGFAPGEDVLAFAGASLASHVTVPARAVAKMPAHWSHADAATIPTVFFTVWYALSHLARLQPGERILIHGAAGGVGLAAIQVAKHLGAEIIASAGSPAKRDFVTLAGAGHVVDSRSPFFDHVVLELTGGEGVDVVLNSLAGEAIARNLRAMRPFGRFIELGKRDFYENTPLGLKPFRNNISYFGVDADQLMQVRPALSSRIFSEVMALFEQGALAPLPRKLFQTDEVVAAFRYMQQAKQTGKVVVDLSVRPQHVRPPALATFNLDPRASYLVTGGLGGFGRETALWLARHGARQLALVSRRGAEAPAATETIAALRAMGVRAEAFACDVTHRPSVAALLAEIAARMAPLRGIVHGAMVLDDAALANLDEARFQRVLAPKLDGALALHELTQGLDLQFFVLYSSGTTLLGNPGQGNYVAANAALEALALRRQRLGLPGCAIAWGPIEDAGVLTRNEAARSWLQHKLGIAPITAARALDALGETLAAGGGVSSVMDLDWPLLEQHLPQTKSPRFAEMRRQFGGGPQAAAGGDLQQELRNLPFTAAHALLLGVLETEVAHILRLPPERTRAAKSVFDFGMDSLMAVEFALSLEKRLGVTIQPMLISENPSLDKIADRLLGLIRGDSEAEAERDILGELAMHHGETELTETLRGQAQPEIQSEPSEAGLIR